MTIYSASQISALRQQLDVAKQFLVQGDLIAARQHISAYYESQASMDRGYTSLAQAVVNNNSLFGLVANENLMAGLRVAGSVNIALDRLRVAF